MKSLVVFLNELSFASERIVPLEEMLARVLSTLAAVRAAKKLRDDFMIAGQVSLAGVALGSENKTLAAILRGDMHKEEWRLLQSLDQYSPWDAYPGASIPRVELQEVNYQGRVSTAMLWAMQNESAILSFALSPDWERDHINAQFHKMDEECNISSSETQIPNISKREHVEAHTTLINEYGHILSPSSVVHQGDGFVIRMFFNDHDPPHFHVMIANDSATTVARYAIKTLDRLSGNVPSSVRKAIEVWAATNREGLLNNWDRCRSGQHPYSL